MPSILTTIRRSIRAGNFAVGIHFLDELAADGLSLSEAISAIQNASEFDKLTDDESHIRYRIYGTSDSGREIVIIVFFAGGRIFLKTVYEPRD